MPASQCASCAWSLVLLLLCPLAIAADTWTLPRTMTCNSANGNYRFTTTPPIRMDAHCLGRLAQKQKDGSYATVWEKQLSNRISPISALVSDSGNYVVTFDSWHSMGRGNNVVVIYGPKGKLVRELALDDFLTANEVMRLPISVSSTWWGTGHELDEKNGCVVLKVKDEPKVKEVRLRLETGQVVEAGTAQPPEKTVIRSLYDRYCLACHDNTGKGNPIIRPAMPELPDFTSATWQKSRTDRDLAQSILLGKGKFHPPLGDRLGNVDVKEMVGLVRAFPSVSSNDSRIRDDSVLLNVSGIRNGMLLFRQYCMVCHGQDGTGALMRPVLVLLPDFTNPGFHKERSDAQVLLSILNGKGTLMPPHQARLTEAQARDLVVCIRAFRSAPKTAPAPEKKVIVSLYNRYCIRCHGVDGRGVWDIPKVPNFTDARWQASRADAEIVRAILEGRGGAPKRGLDCLTLAPPSKVAGILHWAVMPPFEGRLTPEEARGMAGFLRAFAPDNKASEGAKNKPSK